MIIPVILAGGSGTRLWPLSRSAYPKHLLPLVGERTLLQETVLRAKALSAVNPLVICNQAHRFLVAEQLHQIGVNEAVIMLEPQAKNTAPAVALAALQLLQQYENPNLLILPADHFIKETDYFADILNISEQYAESGQLVTFGVKPLYAETGYGYIKRDKEINETGVFHVNQFIEKPDLETATQYIASEEYYWNSGMFLFAASTYLSELAIHAPNILSACKEAVRLADKDLDFIRIHEAKFAESPNISIDYAVMEKTQHAVLVPFHASWSDVGSWNAVWQVHNEPTPEGNVIMGDVVIEDVTNSYLRAENRMLAAIGVTDHIIIETADAVLVAHKDKAQAVKNIVEKLKQKQREEINLHRKVYRPWGSYETIDESSTHRVKRIIVKPRASISLQMHRYRSEHWVVIKGVATVTRGDETFIVNANESTYVPMGEKHRVANMGSEDLELIEVQYGTYVGEDDIVRFEDVYGRVAKTCD